MAQFDVYAERNIADRTKQRNGGEVIRVLYTRARETMFPTFQKLRQSISALVVLSFPMLPSIADAADLYVLSPHAMKPALNDLIPQFERSTGNRVNVSYATTSNLVNEIENGMRADVAILPPEQIERLEDSDKIVEDSSTPVAKLEIGVIVRKGAAKPDIRTVRALKQTLMAARSIASGDPRISESGAYFANLIERLRIAEAIRPKIKSFPSGTAAIDAVANGDADIGVGMVSVGDQCCTEVVGKFPAQAKKSKSYAIGILTSSDQTQAAKALASFISSRNSSTILKSKGFEAP